MSGYYTLVFLICKMEKNNHHLTQLYKDQTDTSTKHSAWHHQCRYYYSSRLAALTPCKGGRLYHLGEDAVSWDKSPDHGMAGVQL